MLPGQNRSHIYVDGINQQSAQMHGRLLAWDYPISLKINIFLHLVCILRISVSS